MAKSAGDKARRYSAVDPEIARVLVEDIFDEDLSDSTAENVLTVALIKEKARAYFGGEAVDHKHVRRLVDDLMDHLVKCEEEPDPKLRVLVTRLSVAVDNEAGKERLFKELILAIETKRKLDETMTKRQSWLMKYVPIEMARAFASRVQKAIDRYVTDPKQKEAVRAELARGIDTVDAGDMGPERELPSPEPS